MEKDYITELYHLIEKSSKPRLIKFISQYYNEKGIKDIASYFIVDLLDAEDEDDQKEAQSIIKKIKSIK